MAGTALSAKAIEEALEERILAGTYARGTSLPSVRRLAAEFGTSPSTVSRALQELERRGWVQVTNRRGATVARSIPRGDSGGGRTVAMLRRLALRWRLSGGAPDEFLRITQGVLDEAFRPDPAVIFVECNPVDLSRMGDQIREDTTIRVVPLLIAEAREHPDRLVGSLVLTPFFHLAEVREIAAPGVELIPLNFVPSPETVQALVDLDPAARVGVIGVDERVRRRVEGIIDQYSLARVHSAILAEPDQVDELLDRADVIVTTIATVLSAERLARARRLVTIEFVLERGGVELSSLAARAAPALVGADGS